MGSKVQTNGGETLYHSKGHKPQELRYITH